MIGIDYLENFFSGRGWKPFQFQREAWNAYLEGKQGLIHAPTGMGKTLAAWGGPLIEAVREGDRGLTPRLLWITPLRALAADLGKNMAEPLAALGHPWTVEVRTGDTSQSQKVRQKKNLPPALIITPESLSLLLSYEDTSRQFSTLRSVVIDEWQELLGSKRGVQTELALARLRTLAPGLRTWALSATLGNLPEAMDVAVGPLEAGTLVQAPDTKGLSINTILPETIERFPWAGHIGLKLLPEVIAQIDSAPSSLLFTNTRSQAEIWFQALLGARPDWAGAIGLHHGSLDRKKREAVEKLLREGKLKIVVCTSSLDLGVDFSPVSQVLQIGSPKGVGRVLQRAGRSGHQPQATSAFYGVPTNAFEIVEFSAARSLVHERRVEAKRPLKRTLDVLAQHLVTVALAGGFKEQELLAEVRSTYAFQDLSQEEWSWCLDFVSRGGPALAAYPEFARVREEGGVYRSPSAQIAKLHRMSIGTITSDNVVAVVFRNGSRVGTIEESFIARLRPGDTFIFAGKILELVQVRESKAYVRRAAGGKAPVAVWNGGRFSLTSHLASAVRKRFDEAAKGEFIDAEMQAIEPMLRLQAEVSRIPLPDELLIEHSVSREGSHLFIFPFEGRGVHEGLGPLLAFRIGKITPVTFTVTVNDYGIELLSSVALRPGDLDWPALLSTDGLEIDLASCLNGTELAKRQFRDIARIAGLVFSGFPGAPKTVKQMQMSSSLFYDVFSKYDPPNLLLSLARREVLEDQLEFQRLKAALQRITLSSAVLTAPARFSPLAFPLYAERLRAHMVSSEKWSDRVRRMAEEMEGELNAERNRINRRRSA